jgi:hypothetical protein
MKSTNRNKMAGILFMLGICTALAVDCYKNIEQNSQCVGGTFSIGACQGPDWQGYTCVGPLGESYITSLEADAAKLSTSRTVASRGCRQYKICTKANSPTKTCWSNADGEQQQFVDQPCPQG